MNRQLPRPRVVAGVGNGELTKPCPKCKRWVKVGGPVNGQWVIQPHAKQEGGVVNCPGTDQKVS